MLVGGKSGNDIFMNWWHISCGICLSCSVILRWWCFKSTQWDHDLRQKWMHFSLRCLIKIWNKTQFLTHSLTNWLCTLCVCVPVCVFGRACQWKNTFRPNTCSWGHSQLLIPVVPRENYQKKRSLFSIEAYFCQISHNLTFSMSKYWQILISQTNEKPQYFNFN